MADSMEHIPSERRKYLRYDTELKVYFRVKYDIKTRVRFQVMQDSLEGHSAHKYAGLCKNVSVEGLCFESKKKLQKGDILLIEVYEPIIKRPVFMDAEVCWSRKFPKDVRRNTYYTGVRLISVNDRSVSDSIYFDKNYKVMWSAALDSLFGSFAAMVRKLKHKHKK